MKSDIIRIKRRTLIFLSHSCKQFVYKKFNLRNILFNANYKRYNDILAVIGHKSDNMKFILYESL